MAYYRVVNGKKYDEELLKVAEKAVAGKGEGKIFIEDAKDLLSKVIEGNEYTAIEKETMEYIRENFKWTQEADAWFRTEIRKWAATRK